MADGTDIEWCRSADGRRGATWNFITGCSPKSPGCTHCWAMNLAGTRLKHHPSRAGLTMDTKAGPVWTGEVRFNEQWLEQPLRWREPRMIFPVAHGDMFHEDVPDEWIVRGYGVMVPAVHLHGHTFQVLTKRTARARKLLSDAGFWDEVNALAEYEVMERVDPLARRSNDARATLDDYGPTNPPPGIWFGASVEDQPRANERIPELLATPAVLHWVSGEPLLGLVRFDRIGEEVDDFKDCGGHPDPRWPIDTKDVTWLNALSGRFEAEAQSPMGWRLGSINAGRVHAGGRIDWIVGGGENGPRPMHPDWARSLRDQCATHGTAFLFKQWGSWAPVLDRERDDPDWRADYKNEFGDSGRTKWLNLAGGRGFHGDRFHVMRRVGKKNAGRLLDGVLHDAMPVENWRAAA